MYIILYLIQDLLINRCCNKLGMMRKKQKMKITLPIQIFPIEEDGYHLKIAITINGIAAVVILDTGASRTVFDETRIVQLVGAQYVEAHDRLSTGLGTNTMESKKVVLNTLQIGTLVLENYEAAVLDLSHVNQSYQKLGLAPVDGVLGSDVLVDYYAVIDYDKKELRLKM
jgi:predicted aspartyl protease